MEGLLKKVLSNSILQNVVSRAFFIRPPQNTCSFCNTHNSTNMDNYFRIKDFLQQYNTGKNLETKIDELQMSMVYHAFGIPFNILEFVYLVRKGEHEEYMKHLAQQQQHEYQMEETEAVCEREPVQMQNDEVTVKIGLIRHRSAESTMPGLAEVLQEDLHSEKKLEELTIEVKEADEWEDDEPDLVLFVVGMTGRVDPSEICGEYELLQRTYPNSEIILTFIVYGTKCVQKVDPQTYPFANFRGHPCLLEFLYFCNGDRTKYYLIEGAENTVNKHALVQLVQRVVKS